jgi:hypothetical protein
MKKQLLGDFSYPYESFVNLDDIFSEFHDTSFHALTSRKRFKRVSKTLLSLIQEAQEPCFLLPAVIEFIDKINEEKILHEPYHFVSFEFWLNKFSKLSDEDNLKIRAKIIGKWIAREEYQSYFPIGMNKTFSGTHFVAAHASPDIDTTIASFWGWVDAFGAKVSEGVHQWSLPGISPNSHFTYLFRELFSKSVFEQLARLVPTLTLTALDLVTQKDFTKVRNTALSNSLDHNHAGKAIVVIDENDHLIGDWRSADAEAVRQIVLLFYGIIRWFENTIHAKLISTFAKKSLHQDDIKNAFEPLFEDTLKNSEPVKDYSEKQKKHLNDYLKKVLNIHQGLHASFKEVGSFIDSVTHSEFNTFYTALKSLQDPELYDKNQKLIEDRPKIFSRLEKIVNDLHQVVFSIRTYFDKLSLMLEIKEKVLSHPLQFVTLKSDVDEIRSKIGNLDYVTVVVPEGDGNWFPVGVIHASDLRKPILGTVSLRDFSNEQETKMASYLEVISVIDHHKTSLKTSLAPCFIIADSQSANTLVAELAFEINTKYSKLGIPDATIEKQIHEIGKKVDDIHSLKLLSRLLQLKLNAKNQSGYYIHPRREFVEYFCYLYAILDDTDLLTKVTARDVDCVVTILNRMKSISVGYDIEIISTDDIPRGASFAKLAAKHILQNEDMYSIYKKIYAFKEQELDADLAACVAGKPSAVFADTKEQNGCCRVGQTKIFRTNYPFFYKHAPALRTIWFNDAKETFETKPQIDFHLHMVSTITSADEVYHGNIGEWDHQDEMWFWVPPTPLAMERLVHFLNAFSSTPAAEHNVMEVEFYGENYLELSQIFEQNLPKAKQKPRPETYRLPIAVLSYKAGSINSRKAQITPYLPRFVP